MVQVERAPDPGETHGSSPYVAAGCFSHTSPTTRSTYTQKPPPDTIPTAKLQDVNGFHYYTTPSGIRLPSVTTVLSKTKPYEATLGLDSWRSRVGSSVADYILTESALIGRQAHHLNELYLQNQTVADLNDTTTPHYSPGVDRTRLLALAHHLNFRQFLHTITTVRGLELPMYSDRLQIAGTADCIAEIDGRLHVVDFKTKRSPQKSEWIHDHLLQGTLYSLMWNDNAPADQQITDITIAVSSERNTLQIFHAPADRHITEATARVTKYIELQKVPA